MLNYFALIMQKTIQSNLDAYYDQNGINHFSSILQKTIQSKLDSYYS